MKTRLLKTLSACLALALLFSVVAFAAPAGEDKPFENSQFFNMGDYSIHYRVFEAQGAFKGRVMMLHGFLSNTVTWEPMVPGLTQAGYTCVLADMPSFGYSTKESAAVSPVDREDLVFALMESIAPADTWFLAGHSMGGGIALNIALEHGEIKGLLLFAPAQTSEIPEAARPFVTSKPAIALMNAFARLATRGKLFGTAALAMASGDWQFAVNYDMDSITKPLSLPGTGEGLLYTTARMKATDIAALPGLTMPILLARGDNDKVLSADLIEELNAALPNAQTITVAGGGHMINENKAAELIPAAVEFLNSHS